ncbi:unnamed protein product, partial [Rotaria sp. Silwood2]
RLDILAAPLITTQLPKQEETVSGKDVALRVVVRGSPRPEAQWFFNDTPIAPENTSYDEEKSEYQLLLKETSVTANEGTYRVVLKNELGETESTPCVLTVLEPVKLTKISPTSEVIDLKVGEPFEICADVDGKEAPKVQLLKDGKEVKFTSIEGPRHVYSVTEVKPEHQGVYKLIAKNKTSSEETGVTLNVTVKPKVEAAKPANDQTCIIGQDTQISWKFSGIEKPQVTWLFNGQPLPTNERFEITET